jgi:hypothetical protein
MKISTLNLVLMAGLPATGKSTLSFALGRDLGWFVIDKDKYKDEFMHQGLDDERARRAAYKRSFDIAHTMLHNEQKSVIFDSASLDLDTLNNARDVVYGCEHIQLKVILCVTSYDLRKQRAQESMYISHSKVDPITKTDYLRLFEHLPSDRLEVDTSAPIEICLAKAKDYLTS